MAGPVLNRATFFFQNTIGQGWSETFYAQGGLSRTALRAKCLSYANGRLPTLANNSWITYIRYGDSNVKRSYGIVQFDTNEFKGAAGDASNNSSDAVNIRLDTGDALPQVHRRSWLCRGIPDDTVNDKEFILTLGVNHAADWFTDMQNFIRTILAGDWGIRYVASTGPTVYAIQKIDPASYVIRRSATRRSGRPFGLLPGRRLTT